MINIKTDSRKVIKGDIFVALKGISSDGHDYINNAIDNGASMIIAEHGEYSIPYIIVKDSREYLEKYLKDKYGKIIEEMTLIGTTGTNGKTTTAYLIYEALNKANLKCGYIGTIGYYLDEKVCDLPNTTPEITDIYDMIISSYEKGYKYMSLEISSQGLSNRRVEGIEFDYGIFTNLTQDHLDYHKTMENYALAKQQLFKQLKVNGYAIVNNDDEYKNYYLLEKNNNITYGFNDSDYQIIDYKMNNNMIFSYKNNTNKYEIETKLIGKYNIYNVLACIIILNKLNISNDLINEIIKSLNPPVGRMDKVNYKNNSIIIDYAHTPDAVNKIISTVKEICIGNIYVVFGCTGERDRLKRPIMTKIVTTNATKAIITIDDVHNEDVNQIINDMLEGNTSKNYEIILDRKDAINRGISLLKENDYLLILGKGHEEFIIIKDKKIPFNDKKVVEELIKEKVLN